MKKLSVAICSLLLHLQGSQAHAETWGPEEIKAFIEENAESGGKGCYQGALEREECQDINQMAFQMEAINLSGLHWADTHGYFVTTHGVKAPRAVCKCITEEDKRTEKDS